MRVLIILTFVLLAVISVYLYFFKSYRVLEEVNGYEIVSNTGKPIPAKLFDREIEAELDRKSVKIKDIVIKFDDDFVNRGSEHFYEYLIIVPSLKMIGSSEDPAGFKLKDGRLYQASKQGDTFHSIYDINTVEENPPITSASFTKDKIVFNTFGRLKELGDSVIIRFYPNKQ